MEHQILNQTLDEHIRQDPRILDVYLDARRRYDELPLYHHGFPHVTRVLYRALLIAQEEGAVDYSVLIPSALLHDIGFCSQSFERLGHDVSGARLAQKILMGLGYDEATCRAVYHCIRAHKGKAETPQTLEAKILYDADVLEKAGLAYLILGGKIVCEFDETIDHFLNREIPDRSKELARGFYTQKARELDGGRLEQVHALLSQVQVEIMQERPDFDISERDLWIEPPPQVSP
jgi:HD superfamily phosphodiesterase